MNYIIEIEENGRFSEYKPAMTKPEAKAWARIAARDFNGVTASRVIDNRDPLNKKEIALYRKESA